MVNPLQEDKGLIEIHKTCVDMYAIWRPTPSHDLGVDGQIEFLEPNTSVSTGHIIAVQSKSGPSYFSNQNDNLIKYYPHKKHIRYWNRLKLPVVLVLHNPDVGLTCYTVVQTPLLERKPIFINISDSFDSSCREFLIESSEKRSPALSPAKVLDKFKNIELVREGNKILTGIDFLLACTNRAENYFEIRMVRITALFRLLSEGDSFGISQEDYEYILRNIIVIHSKEIAEDFLDEFDDMWYGLQTVPDISVPLTKAGGYIIEYLWENISEYMSYGSYAHLQIEDSQLAKFVSEFAQKSSDELDASDRMSIEPR